LGVLGVLDGGKCETERWKGEVDQRCTKKHVASKTYPRLVYVLRPALERGKQAVKICSRHPKPLRANVQAPLLFCAKTTK
jgi:hypothetical protein